jgi:hypothetical protein
MDTEEEGGLEMDMMLELDSDISILELSYEVISC